MANDARNVRVRPQNQIEDGITLLSAQNTTGIGTTFPLGRGYTVFSLVSFRATTGTSGGSTKVSFRLQGKIQNASTNWFTIGAATRNPTSTPVLATVTSTAPISHIRASINTFTTSGGANPDKIKTTAVVLPQL